MVETKLDKIKQAVLQFLDEAEINADKIVIFGSYAKDKQNQDSDIDIIIISKDFRNKDLFEVVEMANDVHWKLVDRFSMAFDIMYYSDLDWDKGNSLIINTAKKDGEVIYEG